MKLDTENGLMAANSGLDVRDRCTLQFMRAILPIGALATLAAIAFIFLSMDSVFPGAQKWLISGYLVALAIYLLLIRFIWIDRIQNSLQLDLMAVSVFFAAEVGSIVGTCLNVDESCISISLMLVILTLAIRRNIVYACYVTCSIAVVLLARTLSLLPFSVSFVELLLITPVFAFMFRFGTEQVWQRVTRTHQQLIQNLDQLEEEKRRREETERELAQIRISNLFSHVTLDRLSAPIFIMELTDTMARIDELRSQGKTNEDIEQLILTTDLDDELRKLNSIADVNQRMLDAVGAKSAKEFNQRFSDSIEPHGLMFCRGFLLRVVLLEQEFETETVHRHFQDDRLVYFQSTSQLLRQEDRVYSLTSLANITEQVELRRKLETSELGLQNQLLQLEREKRLREHTEELLASEREEYMVANVTMDMSSSLVILEDLTGVVSRLKLIIESGESKESIAERIRTTDLFFELVELVKHLDVNARWAEAIGADSIQEGKDRISDTFVEQSMTAFREFFVHVLYEKEFESENIHRHLKTNELLYFRVQAKFFKRAKKTLCICNMTDLTAQTNLNQRLLASEASLRSKVEELEKEKELREKTELQLDEVKHKQLTAAMTLDMTNTLVNIGDATAVIAYFDELRSEGLTNDQIEKRLKTDHEFLRFVHSKINTLDINQRLADTIGAQSREDAIQRFRETFVVESLPALVDFMTSLLTESPFECDNVHRHLVTHELLYFRIQMMPVLDGERHYYVVTLTETTKHDKRTRRQLDESEAKIRLALDATKTAIWEVDIESKTMLAEDDYHKLLGYPAESLNGPVDIVRGLVHPDDKDESQEMIVALMKGTLTRVDRTHRMKVGSGVYRWFRFNMKIAEKVDGHPKKAIGTLADVHDAICAERLVRIERDILAADLDLNDSLTTLSAGIQEFWGSATCAVHIFDSSMRIVDCIAPGLDEAYRSRLIDGRTEDLPKSCQKAIRIGDLAFDNIDLTIGNQNFKHSWSAALTVDKTVHASLCLFSPSLPNAHDKLLFGHFAQVIQQLFVKQFQQKRDAEFESKVLTESKLDSLGKLAGGIAHDFNNLLTVIMTHAELIGLSDKCIESRNSSKQIVEAAEIASGLCEKMLTYAGEIPFELTDLDISSEAKSVVQMVQTGTTKRVHFANHLAQNLPAVVGDRAMISQLILNLLTNAVEATPPDGQITVSTGKRYLDDSDLSQFYFSDWLEAGEYVFLRVSDNGCGIKSDLIERIFDPFFTTKKLGTGLGLATVVGVTRRHKGCLQVTSKENEGTTVLAYLPATAESIPNEPDSEFRLAIVDDQPAVLSALELMLQKHGFAVVTMASGEEAVERLDELQRCDGIILDQQMPGMDGIETYRYIRKSLKVLPICFVSGYTLTEEASQIVRLDPNCESLTKPFSHRILIKVIREMVGEGEMVPSDTPIHLK